MSKTSKRLAVVMPAAKDDKLIAAAAEADPDAQPRTPKQLASLRYSSEVLAFFRATGDLKRAPNNMRGAP